MRAAPTIVLLALLLAGCAGSAPSASVTPAASNATLAPAALNATATSNVTHIDMLPAVRIAYEGSSPTGVCTYGTPADQCQLSDPGKEGFHAVAYVGKAQSIEVGVSYGALQPGSAFYASICTSKDADPKHATCNDYRTGASPIVLRKDLKDVPAGAPSSPSARAASSSRPRPPGRWRSRRPTSRSRAR